MLTVGIISALMVVTYGIPALRFYRAEKRPEALVYAERKRNAAFGAEE